MYRYESLVSLVHEWLAGGVLKPGDRMLSVREMSQRLGYSAVTVHHAYGILEDEGVLESRPRSGFFVSRETRPLPEFSASSADFSAPDEVETVDHEFDLEPALVAAGAEIESFGNLSISRDLLPHADLYRHFVARLRWEGAQMEAMPWQGALELREAIAKRPGVVSRGLNAKDILVTHALDGALALCLDILVKRGDKVLVETPTDAGTVAVLLRRRLEMVEIYSHPRFGVDPEQFNYLLQHNDFAACILSGSSHVPTGVCYPLDTAQAIVEAATRKGVPIIENLTGQDLLYGTAGSIHLAQFDTRNLVVRIGGLADTLGSRFGLGWVALPRRHYGRLARPFLQRTPLAGELARQQAIADFLGRRTYERHLRKLRETLSSRMRKGLSMLFQRFPESCTVSRPTGGYFCWVRGPKTFNAVAGAKLALADGVSFAPGPLFSVTRSFGNFMALNLSFAWTPDRERQIDRIGELLHTPP